LLCGFSTNELLPLPAEVKNVRQAFVIATLTLSGCASLAKVDLAVDADTVELTGWFSARGEWALFHTARLSSDYYPYPENEDERCLTLVNATGSPRSDYAGLDGKLVTVSGMRVQYDSLLVGQSDVDVLLQRRYFNDEPVFDSCARFYVFAVSGFH
jgi:hypothetical protein